MSNGNGGLHDHHLHNQSSTPHRLLRGGRFPYANKLSAREMMSLTAICDTFLPSMDISGTGDESLATFYATSASMAGTPESVCWLSSSVLFLFPCKHFISALHSMLGFFVFITYMGFGFGRIFSSHPALCNSFKSIFIVPILDKIQVLPLGTVWMSASAVQYMQKKVFLSS